MGMEPPIASRRQWGGFVEAAILGHVWQMQVAFFLELHGGDVAMMTEPVGTGAKGRICLWWRGTHYDLLVLSDAIWSRCCAQRAGHRSRDPLVRLSAPDKTGDGHPSWVSHQHHLHAWAEADAWSRQHRLQAWAEAHLPQ